MKSIYETTGGTYQRQGDYKLPSLKLSPEEEKFIGIWGQRYRWYLKQNHRIRYYNLLTSGTLNEHIAEVDRQADIMFQSLVKSFAEQENITEQMKSECSMEWVKKMNNIRNRAAEIVNAEMIYVWGNRNIISAFRVMKADLCFKIWFGFGKNCTVKVDIPTQ